MVVGEGPERARLEQLARDLDVSGAVIFAGFVPDNDLPNYYALASLYLHTGRLESFGLSVLEASRSGVPVVSVDEGGPREIIEDGRTGLLVPASPDALAAACERSPCAVDTALPLSHLGNGSFGRRAGGAPLSRRAG